MRSLAAQGRTIFFCSRVLRSSSACARASSSSTTGSPLRTGRLPRCAQAGAQSLEEAFVALTGTRDTAQVTHELLEALER
jgi:hypothetical protein